MIYIILFFSKMDKINVAESANENIIITNSAAEYNVAEPADTKHVTAISAEQDAIKNN